MQIRCVLHPTSQQRSGTKEADGHGILPPPHFCREGRLKFKERIEGRTFICPPSVPPKHIMVPYPATTVPFALPAPLNIYGSISGDGGGAVELAAIWSAYQMRRWHRRSRKDGPPYLTSDQKLPGMTRTEQWFGLKTFLDFLF